jgi:hypothetical protein
MVGTGRFELPKSLRDGSLARFYLRDSATLCRNGLGVLVVGQFTTRP